MIIAILEFISHYILLIIQTSGYFGVFFLMFLTSINIPVPSEIIMPFSGFLVSKGVFDFWIVVAVGVLGDSFGSICSYGVGYLVRKGVLKWNNHKVSADIEKTKLWLDKFGNWAIFISRLLPVARTFISFPLGILGLKSLVEFSFFSFAGSFAWALFLTSLGFVSGENWNVVGSYFRKFDYLILIIFFAAITLFLINHFKFNKKRK